MSGVAYYEIDSTGDGNANKTTNSNFIPEDGYDSCSNRFRAVDKVGNKGTWTENVHIHVHKHKDSCYSTSCKGSFTLSSSTSTSYYTCTHYHSAGGGGVWSGTDRTDGAYYNSSGGCYTKAGTYSQAYSCGATKAYYNPNSMCYCGACGKHVASINYTTGTTVNVHYTLYPIGQTCTKTVWKQVTKYTRNCGKTSGQSQSFSRTVQTYRCGTCGKTTTYYCAANNSCGICGGRHSVGASGAKTTTHNAVKKYLICGK